MYGKRRQSHIAVDPYRSAERMITGGQDKIKLTKEQRTDMVSSIKRYFKHEREEEVGDLGAGLILDFVIEKLAPEFYNQGVSDSSRYMSDRIEDMMSIQVIRAK
jgi:uncharacterized protein (DUF2164 family)